MIKKTMSMPTSDFHGVNSTDTDCLLAKSDAIVKGKKSHWGLVCDQYADMFEKPGEPMDCTITHHIDLIDESI